jgi:hypothetical protein
VATTTWDAFDEFKAKLKLTEAQQNTVGARRTTTDGYLRDAFPATSDLPFSRSTLVGSAGRHTIIRPLDDVDVMAEFNNKNNIFERYRHDSQAFLYRIRDALSGYSVKIVGARGQAVRLFYTNAPHVDIAPVFKWNGAGYALPNGTGAWLTTDPVFHSQWLDEQKKALGTQLRPLIRMMKRWNSEHSNYLKSFHLEILVASGFTSLGNDTRQACEMFFRWAQSNLSVNDPAGHSGDLSSYLTTTRRLNLLSNLASAQGRAERANAAEALGNHREAIRLWRVVFGGEFPAYG